MKREFFREAGNWFGYSRRERRASLILMIIIGLLLAIRFLWPSGHEQPEFIIADIPRNESDSVIHTGKVFRPYTGQRGKTPDAGTKIIELNRCDSASLEALRGIGPVLARRIIRYRNLLGGYSSPDQLKEVYGLTDSTFLLIKGRVKADPGLIRKINVNSADFRRLSRLPYLEKNDVNAILDFRSRNGRVENVDQLVRNYVISVTKAEKAGRYMEFGE